MAKNIFKKVFSFGKSTGEEAEKAPQKSSLTPYEQARLEGRIKNQTSSKPPDNSDLGRQLAAKDPINNQQSQMSSRKPQSGIAGETLLKSASVADEMVDAASFTYGPMDANSRNEQSETDTVANKHSYSENVDDAPSSTIKTSETLNSLGREVVEAFTTPNDLVLSGSQKRPNDAATIAHGNETITRIIVDDRVTPVGAQDDKEPGDTAVDKRPWFERLKHGLSRSSRQLGDSISAVFTKRKLDDDTLQDFEDVLIQADLGLETAMRITDSLAAGRYGKDIATDDVRAIIGEEIKKVLETVAKPLELDLSHKPHIILVVGVNGTGKTTTIGKLAAKLTRNGLKVMLAAGDTFRAAAIEQLHIWGDRTGAPVISSKLGADAAGLAFEAFRQAKDNGSDVLIIDTAGRLQNKTELMDELAKIVRVLGKIDPEAPHTVLQTLDATTGQNALNQVEIFRNIAGVNGLVMTKLDGTARGGILVAIAAKYKIPVHFIGVGEGINDLEPFAASDFANAIAGKHS